jgi:diguanylate cyclase (GGDEF)-like protein
MERITEIQLLEKAKNRIEYMDNYDETMLMIRDLINLVEEKNKVIKETAETLKEFKSNMADLQEEMSEIKESAKRDALTGLYNRKAEKDYFEEVVESFNDPEKEAPETLHVVAIDLDHFKSINDTYGHDVGDDALIIVARGLESYFRRKDLVVREGGDEFLIIAKDCPPDILEEKLAHMAEAIRNNVNSALDSNRRVIDGEEVSITRPHDYTVSYGYTELDLSQLNQEMLDDDEAFVNWFNSQKKAADDASFDMKKSHHAVRR